jgi:predicted methyltransferase
MGACGRMIAAALAFAALAACTPVNAPGRSSEQQTEQGPSAAEQLAAVLADPRRDADRARDVWRHPQETLEFFGVTPNMVVAEVNPGEGWYTRVLVPYVGERGGYMAIEYSRQAHALLDADRSRSSAISPVDMFLSSFPALAAASGPAGSNVIGAYAFDEIPSELYGTVDAVLFLRSLHNLQRTGTLQGALAEAYALLKPGGVVGVEQHRAKPDATDSYVTGDKGYLREADVIAAFAAAGFVFEEASEINANPDDPANWPNGVWTLPPELTLGVLDREDYIAIGESDRMTLRFRKPAAPPLGG